MFLGSKTNFDEVLSNLKEQREPDIEDIDFGKPRFDVVDVRKLNDMLAEMYLDLIAVNELKDDFIEGMDDIGSRLDDCVSFMQEKFKLDYDPASFIERGFRKVFGSVQAINNYIIGVRERFKDMDVDFKSSMNLIDSCGVLLSDLFFGE